MKPEKNFGLTMGKNTIKRYTTPVFCSECGDKFDTKNSELTIRWCADPMEAVDMICPKCMDKWNKHWELKEVISWHPDKTIVGAGVARCKMKDGRIYDHHYGIMNEANADIPGHFFAKFQQCAQAYYEIKRAVMLAGVEVIDTFEKSLIRATQNNGNVTTLRWKRGANGVVLDHAEVAKVDPVLFRSIVEKLKERQIYVQGVK